MTSPPLMRAAAFEKGLCRKAQPLPFSEHRYVQTACGFLLSYLSCIVVCYIGSMVGVQGRSGRRLWKSGHTEPSSALRCGRRTPIRTTGAITAPTRQSGMPSPPGRASRSASPSGFAGFSCSIIPLRAWQSRRSTRTTRPSGCAAVGDVSGRERRWSQGKRRTSAKKSRRKDNGWISTSISCCRGRSRRG